jgi:hypothetical protein
MAILEINLEKPALIEEYQYPEQTGRTASAGRGRASAASTSSGGNKGKLLGLLAVLAGVGVMVWKIRGRGGTEQTEFDEFEAESEYEHGPDPEIGGDESGGRTRKVAGLLGFAVALVTVVAAVRKARK